MIVKDPATLAAFEERFGGFHDGFIKRIDVVSGSKFETHCPWEAAPELEGKIDRLHAAGWAMYGDHLLRIVIPYYNYDWPNQPFDREVWLTIPRPLAFAPDLIRHVGTGIFDLSCLWREDRIEAELTWHDWSDRPADGPWTCTMENGRRATLWTARRFHVAERRWGLKEADPC